MINVNLLPQEEKRELELIKISFKLRSFVFCSLISFLIFIIFLGNTLLCLSILLRTQKELVEIRQNDKRTQYLLEMENKIKEINSGMERIIQKQGELFLWTPLLEELAKTVPQGAILTGISYSPGSQRVSLSGVADGREEVLFFQQALEKNKYCFDLEAPLSNLLKQREVNFTFTFKPRQ
jgi:Tfp pilus assembly protein PilN